MNVGQSTQSEQRQGPRPAGETVHSGGSAGGSALSRTVWIILLVVPAAVLATAAVLSPDPAGHGTHTQLGLPPCGFLLATGLPCPGCGLTTSFSHMIRLQVVGAAEANPTGILLFVLTAACIPLALVGWVRKLPVIATLDRLHFEKVAVVVALVALIVWGARTVPLLLG